MIAITPDKLSVYVSFNQPKGHINVKASKVFQNDPNSINLNNIITDSVS